MIGVMIVCFKILACLISVSVFRLLFSLFIMEFIIVIIIIMIFIYTTDTIIQIIIK